MWWCHVGQAFSSLWLIEIPLLENVAMAGLFSQSSGKLLRMERSHQPGNTTQSEQTCRRCLTVFVMKRTISREGGLPVVESTYSPFTLRINWICIKTTTMNIIFFVQPITVQYYIFATNHTVQYLSKTKPIVLTWASNEIANRGSIKEVVFLWNLDM